MEIKKIDYVNIKTMKLLESIGFNLKSYSCKYDVQTKEFSSIRYDYGIYRKFNPNKTLGKILPTLYDAQKWLREKHKLHIVVYPTYTLALKNKIAYLPAVYIKDDIEYKMENIFVDENTFSSYEKALNSAIIGACKFILKKR